MRCAHYLLALAIYAALFGFGNKSTRADTLAKEKRMAPDPARREADFVFKGGANCLFIGHSFFIPVAKRFDEVAKRSNFPSHRVDVVFAPGLGGSPGKLWDNDRRRQTIETKLATGKVDLLGMTAFGNRNSDFKDYQRWIKMALKYNPKTRFFIGQSWTFGGPKMKHKLYQDAIERGGTRMFKTVTELRKAFPNNHVYFIDYGKIASEMKARFEAGQLPAIEKMVGRDGTALFRDGVIGHGGPMMLELSSLCWLNVLYGADLANLTHTPYTAAVLDIAEVGIKYNERFK